MPTISGVSANALSSLSTAQAAPAAKAQQAAKPATSAKGVDTSDTVKISAETKSELAQGKPFFASADATGAATDEASVGKAEERRKMARLEKLQQRSDDVQERGAGKLERLKKRGPARKERIGGRLIEEQATKKERAGDQSKRIGGKEETVKASAADRSKLLIEEAKKRGTPVDQKRLDRIGDRVKDESAQKDTRLEGADARRISKERRVKTRAGVRLEKGGIRDEMRIKASAGNTDKKLNKIEERMKQLDPVRDGGGEQKIKASATPGDGTTTGAATPTEAAAAATKTDVL